MTKPSISTRIKKCIALASFTMTLYQFNILPQQEQETVIFEQSKFLHVVSKGGLKYGLYSRDKFFIEVICNSESLKVIEINAFERGHLISKYSEWIRPQLSIS